MRRPLQAGSATGLALAATAAAVAGLGLAWWIAQPDMSVGQYERLGAVIGCTCGTCPLRPIATCGCGFADGMLGELAELVAEGHDDETVMATFASRYGEAIRIQPASSGLDLTAWAAPMLLLTVGAVVVGAVVVRWARGGAAVAGDEGRPDPLEGDLPPVPGTEEERLRTIVERELEDLEP